LSRRRLVVATGLCLALASVGAAVWQPWNKLAEPDHKKLLTNSIGLKMVWVPPGEYSVTMSRDDGAAESPSPRQVTIPLGFYISVEPITVAQFKTFVDKNHFKTTAEKDGKGALHWSETKKKWDQDANCTWRTPLRPQTDQHPVVCVSRYDAIAFCYWLNRQEKKFHNLPNDDEWAVVFGNGLLDKGANSGKTGTAAPRLDVPPRGPLLGQFPFGFWEWCMSSGDSRQELGLLCSAGRGGTENGLTARHKRVRPDLPRNDTGFRVVQQGGVR
jgi:formylglycine-generating enzyme required for sulfatase activity